MSRALRSLKAVYKLSGKLLERLPQSVRAGEKIDWRSGRRAGYGGAQFPQTPARCLRAPGSPVPAPKPVRSRLPAPLLFNRLEMTGPSCTGLPARLTDFFVACWRDVRPIASSPARAVGRAWLSALPSALPATPDECAHVRRSSWLQAARFR